ncbi:hypothetical protein TYRP_016923, partial [Tyrophagus putrescentiae]
MSETRQFLNSISFANKSQWKKKLLNPIKKLRLSAWSRNRVLVPKI